MDILVKVSGDLGNDERFYDWLSSIINPADKLFVLCGGGTLITEVLEQQSIPFEFGPNGREIQSPEGKDLARLALETQRTIVVKRLQEKAIDATVLIPVTEIGDKICHINGDNYAIALYPNFDRIIIVTSKERVKSFPRKFTKIAVVHLTKATFASALSCGIGPEGTSW